MVCKVFGLVKGWFPAGLLDFGDHLQTQNIEFSGGGTLLECIQRVLDYFNEGKLNGNFVSLPVELLSGLTNLVLYLCSTNLELRPISREAQKIGEPKRPAPQKTRDGMRYFSPDEPRVWETGFRIGPALAASRESEAEAQGGTHKGPRPHLRRAHWHTFRVGADRRNSQLKWMHPMLIGVGEKIPTSRNVPPVEAE
jgi:hypothetical protein